MQNEEDGSFFQKSHPMLQNGLLLYLWARQCPVTDGAEVDKGTAIGVYQWFHEVCSTKLFQTPIILGGTVSTAVQVDESLFCHKPKVSVQIR